MKRLLYRNPVTGVESWFHYDELQDRTTIQTTQDVAPIIDNNKRLQNEDSHDFSGKWGRHIASIPLNIYMKWIQEDGIDITTMPKRDLAKYIKRKLADPEYAYLRIGGKRRFWMGAA